jgi:hypothetical protein
MVYIKEADIERFGLTRLKTAVGCRSPMQEVGYEFLRIIPLGSG